jgi:hypothetical protein
MTKPEKHITGARAGELRSGPVTAWQSFLWDRRRVHDSTASRMIGTARGRVAVVTSCKQLHGKT